MRDVSASCLYTEIANEIFIPVSEVSIKELQKDFELFHNKQAIHLFLLEYTNQVIDEVSRLILSLDQKSNKNINLYCPRQEIFQKINLHQKINPSYNYLVNLWDEITLNDLEQPLEYMFYEANGVFQRKTDCLALELHVPKQFTVCYCVGGVDHVYERVSVNTTIYCCIRYIEEYQHLCEVVVDQGFRKRLYLIFCGELMKRDQVEKDGFHYMAVEE